MLETNLLSQCENTKDVDIDAVETNAESNQNTTSGKHNLVEGPKRKAAILMAYCGENYHGMAMNRGDRQFKTIEGELVSALVKARLVPENCWDDPNKMTYKIASRTDKGVSTCGQVASLKMIMNENVVELLNEQLPLDIRVLAAKRTTKGFSAQQCAGSRTYSYTLPTFAFANSNDVSNEYRISKEKLERIQAIIDKYKGTHSYHNFTSGKRMGEMSAQRYIIDFYYEAPFLQGKMEFMTFKLKGQSFMIHQIRKMIGLMIVLVTGHAKDDYFQQAFDEPLVDIPKAPGTGLVLERVHYDGYNKKQGHLHGGIDFTHVEDKIEEFRRSRILPSIYRKEEEESSMLEWLKTLSYHDYTGKRAKEDWEKQNAMRKSAQEKANSLGKDPQTSSNVSSLEKEDSDLNGSKAINNLTDEQLSEPPEKKGKS